MNTLIVDDVSNSFSLTTPAMYSAPSESAHLADDTTTTLSDGAHLAETPQVVGNSNIDAKPWKDILGDDCILRKKEEGQPAATQGGQAAATLQSENCTHCGDTHPAVSSAASEGSCRDKAPEPNIPQRAQGASVDEWCSYCDDRVVEYRCGECPA